MEEIYTLQEVAKKLKISERTLFRHLKQGKISGSKIGRWRFTEKDIKQLLSKHKFPGPHIRKSK